jgi:membrane protein DedA with SNARE-associated domain
VLRYGRRAGLHEARLERVETFYERYEGAALLFGRFVGFLRPLVPFVAGAAGMRRPRFLVYNTVAGILWAVVTALIGYFLAGS